MSRRDIKSHVDAVQTLAPATRNSNVNGSAVDLKGFNSAMVVFNTGAVTDGTHTPTVEEADASGGPWTAVAAADLQGTLANLSANAVQRVGYLGNKQFIRAQVNSSGATGAAYGAIVNRGLPSLKPTA